MIKFLGEKPFLSTLRSDKSFRISVDIGEYGWDQIKEIPSLPEGNYIITIQHEEEANTGDGSEMPNKAPESPSGASNSTPKANSKRSYAYYYTLVKDLAELRKATSEELDNKIKSTYKVESKNDLSDEQFQVIINQLRNELGLNPPV